MSNLTAFGAMAEDSPAASRSSFRTSWSCKLVLIMVLIHGSCRNRPCSGLDIHGMWMYVPWLYDAAIMHILWYSNLQMKFTNYYIYIYQWSFSMANCLIPMQMVYSQQYWSLESNINHSYEDMGIQIGPIHDPTWSPWTLHWIPKNIPWSPYVSCFTLV